MRGFTLIELLVVITIIGILAAIGLNTFPQAQKQARDQTRKSDINQYSVALESYYNAVSGYPGGASGGINATQLCTITTGVTWTQLMPTCPDDPITSLHYRYSGDGGGDPGSFSTKYVLWTQLESLTPTTFWVVCSDGRSKNYQAPSLSVSSGSCPL